MLATQNFSPASIFSEAYLLASIRQIREPLHLLKHPTTQAIACVLQSDYENLLAELQAANLVHVGILPAMYPEWLGDAAFNHTHKVRFPYIVGEMANGIATAKMVIAAAKQGLLGFFGAAGLMPAIIEKNLHEIKAQLSHVETQWGANLIHSPQEPHLEAAVVNLFLNQQVRRVSASAYMGLSPHIVHYACKGLSVDGQGQITRQNYILAKLSRPEVAKHFMSPPPAEILAHLVASGKITKEEAKLASLIPVAEDITVEADSGGHTDNRPLTSLFPVIHLLSERLSAEHRYKTPIRIGVAGGLGTPAAVAAAFGLGAAYVLTGSINQSALEAGLSVTGKHMLAQATLADVAMAPAADMFELGVKLQVLKRGNFFVARANKLYELYSRYPSLEAIPEDEKLKLEKDIFQAPLTTIWETTQTFFNERDPEQIVLANKDPKHRMALVFRWYLGLSSQWAIKGDGQRKMDYQIWCGPAMGAFNQWVQGTCLEKIEQRSIAQIACNLLEGAAVISRAQQLRSMGVPLPGAAFCFQPELLAE